jgi:hypothetical protein
MMSKERRAQYYLCKGGVLDTIKTAKGKVPPAKYRKPQFKSDDIVTPSKLKDGLIIKDGKLYDWTTSEFILANPGAAGTPNLYTINSQDFYSGNIRFNRAKITIAIKESMLPYVKHCLDLHKFPVIISLQVHDIVDKANWDILNRSWIYTKCFEDLIASGQTGKKDRDKKNIQYFKPLIPDDNIKWVAGSGGTTFHPVKTTEERKLVFFIKHIPEFNIYPFYGG